MPITEEDWKIVANNLYRVWNFLNCGGAVDCKHIALLNLLIAVHIFIIIRVISTLYFLQWWMLTSIS